MNLNKVIMAGNLTNAPEIRYTPNGSAVSEFSMAVNRKYKSGEEFKQETCFIACVAWGKTAETIAHHMQKGSPLFIEGRLQRDTWTDKETGKNRSKLKIVVESFQFIGSKSGEKGPNTQTANEPPPQFQQPEPSAPIAQGATYMPPSNPNNATYTGQPPVQDGVHAQSGNYTPETGTGDSQLF